jgi:hypothetical protein
VVITLDALPAQMRSGETYQVGYTVLQHGITPFLTTETGIWARAQDGQALSFPGTAQGAPGHYVAEVRLPTAGSWSWEVGAGPFERQQLGSLTILPATEGVPAAPAAGRPSNGRVARAALPLATLCAGLLFVVEVADVWRTRPSAAGDRQPRLSPRPGEPRGASA